ncbi:MAG: CinA family nicotinamide mononucleotide deamidase-related protein [Candidatus Anammoximicrobium sp.]|nr:CinA family nicotinamide mononucleotide deamidase-related protein [Candidatus Anammoximicrobium sp.]
MRAEIIALGDELASGQRLDTNSQWLSQQLADLGIQAFFHTTVGDDLEAGTAVFRQAVQRADVVVSTGGLGPTADDLTRECLAQVGGVDLVQDEAVLAQIRALFARRGREMPERNVVQAMFPRGSRVIPNPHGTAPGIDLEVPRIGRPPARIFALPGVPAEMRDMWKASVQPALAALTGPNGRVIRHRSIHCFGAGESAIEAMLPDLVRRGRLPSVGITASQATITLRIAAKGSTPKACLAAIQPTAETIYQCLGNLIFGEDGQTLQDAVILLLAQRRQTLATVECGSGGMLAAWLSSADPEQRAFQGGLVLRDPASQQGLLKAAGNVAAANQAATASDPGTLAAACRTAFRTDYAFALGPFPPPDSPAAGPAPVQFALADATAVRLHSTPYAGHPDILLERTVKEALNFVRLTLLGADRTASR